MSSVSATSYADAKARIERALKRMATFIAAVDDFSNDKTNVVKRVKISGMLCELSNLRSKVEADVQVMESAVNLKLVHNTTSHTVSSDLADIFDTQYYDLLTSADIFGIQTSVTTDMTSSIINQSSDTNITASSLANFHLPKRKFPTFSGQLSEWQGFEDLFTSMLSHVPTLPDVERFEILKTSLEGEALALIKHLPVTALNYNSAWAMLRTQYGNKRDLSRLHLDALLSHKLISSNSAQSIKIVINSIVENIAALNNLGFLTKQWSPILIHIFEKSLDRDLRSKWELTVGNRQLPTVDEFVDFLRSYLRAAEAMSFQPSVVKDYKKDFKPNPYNSFSKPSRGGSVSKVLATSLTPAAVKCNMCPGKHELRNCPLFLIKTPKDRYNITKEHRLCVNCLRSGHSSGNCLSKFLCKTCNKAHHSLLHFETELTGLRPGKVVTSKGAEAQEPSCSSSNINCNSAVVNNETVSEDSSSLISLTSNSQHKSQVLLSTCLVQIKSSTNEIFSLRALLDSGAEASFITDYWATRLSLRRSRCKAQVSALSNTPLKDLRGMVALDVKSVRVDGSIQVNAIVVPSITSCTPQTHVSPGKWNHVSNLQFADPSYYKPGPVDLFLGADIFPSVLLGGIIKGQPDEPIALNTIFGWVLMGKTGSSGGLIDVKSLHVTVPENLDDCIKKFWEVEEPLAVQCLTPDEVQAEQIFSSTVTRIENGRFMVSLPFRDVRPILGESRKVASQRLMSLEQRLHRNQFLREQYNEFMKDYLACQHMERVPIDVDENPYSYYIPHHCVLKPDSTTTKLRVVFNASSKTSTGQSLNEMLLCGPKLLLNLQFILLRLRLPKYVFMADIKQMYRQILITPNDRDYLRILWRFNVSEPITTYRLCTVTYGTSCAPHQAIRTLRELADKEKERFPEASEIIMNDTYVDDVLAGAETEDNAVFKQSQLIALCKCGLFELRKWAGNSEKILHAVPEESRSMSPSVLFDDVDNVGIKVLGLQWDPKLDMFSYKLSCSPVVPTKRTVLSEIAKVFDPIGLLTPVTFLTKHLMQKIWIAGIGWDDPIPTDAADIWSRFRNEFPKLSNVVIPRRITADDSMIYQLHVFTDSSEKGYAAGVYLRVSTPTTVTCHLVTAKSKVASLKCISIPRLELCAAVLGAKLLRTISDLYQNLIPINRLHAWTDSTTVLAWIHSSPHRWATFVANRTSQLQDLTAPAIWRHVPTKENPVDCASRGLFPTELISHHLWWTGPAFLKRDESLWPGKLVKSSISVTPVPELRKVHVNVVTKESNIQTLLEKWSSWEKIKRIVSYCLKWKSRTKVSSGRQVTPSELEAATFGIVRSVQQLSFREIIDALKMNRPVAKPYRQLDLFIDSVGLVRVGGRIRNADIPYEQKHPILLPKSHRLTEIIVDAYHSRLHHQGASALQANLQRDFWIMSARQMIRSRLRRCIPCFRQAPRNIDPKMASLPRYRVQQIKPFAIAGVDYAGPISIKCSRGRKIMPTQAYICLFVCLNTKAIHLEVSSDLSTESFFMALSRFAARRGPIVEIHSDNGTNFVGASNRLNAFTSSEMFQSSVSQKLGSQGIRWCFNPPSAPHFGGLWEAGVKSTKTLLLRSIGTHKLTYEELSTVLTRIEATLNSRPLCALSNDPIDLEALTPSHSLTLEPSSSLPDPSLAQVPMSILQRWRLVTDIHTCFWSGWRNEYLVSLQIRRKWTKDEPSVKVDDLVLIKEPSSPMTWKLGRIEKLHTGSDGITRVVTVRTQHGSLTRPVIKLCPLPML